MVRGIDGAALIACVTAILFGWGATYHQGYIAVFNLDSDVMERTFHQVVYQGAVLTMAPLVFLLIIFVVFLILYSDLILPLLMATIESSDKNKQIIRRLKEGWEGKRQPSTKELKAQSRSWRALWTILALLIYYLSLQGMYHAGQEQGQQRLEKFLPSDTSSSDNKNGLPGLIIHVKLDGKGRELAFIDCGARNCAGLDLKSNKVVYFPVEAGYSFELVTDKKR